MAVDIKYEIVSSALFKIAEMKILIDKQQTAYPTRILDDIEEDFRHLQELHIRLRAQLERRSIVNSRLRCKVTDLRKKTTSRTADLTRQAEGQNVRERDYLKQQLDELNSIVETLTTTYGSIGDNIVETRAERDRLRNEYEALVDELNEVMLQKANSKIDTGSFSERKQKAFEKAQRYQEDRETIREEAKSDRVEYIDKQKRLKEELYKLQKEKQWLDNAMRNVIRQGKFRQSMQLIRSRSIDIRRGTDAASQAELVSNVVKNLRRQSDVTRLSAIKSEETREILLNTKKDLVSDVEEAEEEYQKVEEEMTQRLETIKEVVTKQESDLLKMETATKRLIKVLEDGENREKEISGDVERAHKNLKKLEERIEMRIRELEESKAQGINIELKLDELRSLHKHNMDELIVELDKKKAVLARTIAMRQEIEANINKRQRDLEDLILRHRVEKEKLRFRRDEMNELDTAMNAIVDDVASEAQTRRERLITLVEEAGYSINYLDEARSRWKKERENETQEMKLLTSQLNVCSETLTERTKCKNKLKAELDPLIVIVEAIRKELIMSLEVEEKTRAEVDAMRTRRDNTKAELDDTTEKLTMSRSERLSFLQASNESIMMHERQIPYYQEQLEGIIKENDIFTQAIDRLKKSISILEEEETRVLSEQHALDSDLEEVKAATRENNDWELATVKDMRNFDNEMLGKLARFGKALGLKYDQIGSVKDRLDLKLLQFIVPTQRIFECRSRNF